jgi:drug/metabolite transporter (DMT)-like permease
LLGLPEPLLAGAVDWIGAAAHQPIELGSWDWAGLQSTVLALVAALPGPIALLHNGQVLMLLAALSMAGGTIVSRIVSDRADTVNATGWHMIIGSVPLLALSWGQEVEPWSALAYSTVFGSAIAYALFFYFASTGSITSLSSLTFLTPVFAILFGNLFLAEQLTGLQWLGVGLTLVSIYLINQRGQAADQVDTTLRDRGMMAEGAEPIVPGAPAAEVPSKP